jgi:hypothetical protein
MTTNPATESTYHADAKCGCCGGRLETDRDAICHTCSPDDPGPMLVSPSKAKESNATEAADNIKGFLACDCGCCRESIANIIGDAIDAATAELREDNARLRAEVEELKEAWLRK